VDPRAFYDALAPWYHLVYRDWEASIAGQGQALASLLAAELGSPPHRVLDAAVGVGTQALGLAGLGFEVTGSDISGAAINRAGEEAARRGIRLPCLIADLRSLPVRSATFDAVIACDNAVPHLLSEDEIHQAFRDAFGVCGWPDAVSSRCETMTLRLQRGRSRSGTTVTAPGPAGRAASARSGDGTAPSTMWRSNW